mgnify:FL=1
MGHSRNTNQITWHSTYKLASGMPHKEAIKIMRGKGGQDKLKKTFETSNLPN